MSGKKSRKCLWTRMCVRPRALLSWTPWHTSLPACCFSEEVNEAALGRLGHSMRRHPDATSVEDVIDLWLRTRPGNRGYRKIRPGGVDHRWDAMARDHIDQLLQRCSRPVGQPVVQGGAKTQLDSLGDVITYVSVSRRDQAAVPARDPAEPTDADDESECPDVATDTWPENWRPPPVPTAAVAERLAPELQSILQKSLRTLLQDKPPAPAVAVEMDTLCARRDAVDAEAYQRAWDTFTGRPPARPTPGSSSAATTTGEPMFCFIHFFLTRKRC